MAAIKVKPYYRTTRSGRAVKIKGHVRKRRGLGKKISYDKSGTFYVAHDELGNFRGSKVVPFKKQRLPAKNKVPSNDIDQQYFNGLISYEDMIKKKKERLGV